MEALGGSTSAGGTPRFPKIRWTDEHLLTATKEFQCGLRGQTGVQCGLFQAEGDLATTILFPSTPKVRKKCVLAHLCSAVFCNGECQCQDSMQKQGYLVLTVATTCDLYCTYVPFMISRETIALLDTLGHRDANCGTPGWSWTQRRQVFLPSEVQPPSFLHTNCKFWGIRTHTHGLVAWSR